MIYWAVFNALNICCLIIPKWLMLIFDYSHDYFVFFLADLYFWSFKKKKPFNHITHRGYLEETKIAEKPCQHNNMIVILNRSIHMILSNFCLFTKKSQENIVILVKFVQAFCFQITIKRRRRKTATMVKVGRRAEQEIKNHAIAQY